MSQANLFGEPPLLASESMWFTPPALARRVAAWIPPTARTLEPSCGGGNLIAALIERGHDPKLITGVEKDAQWAEHTRVRFDGKVQIVCADFLTFPPASDQTEYAFEWSFANPPFDRNQHSAFIEGMLDMGIPNIVAILPESIEFGVERARTVWSKGKVVRRARLAQRVSYGGSFSASFDTVVLHIVKRTEPRRADEILVVREELWL